MPPRAKNTGEPALVALLKEAGVHNAKDINNSTLRKIYKLEDDVPARRSAAAGSSSNSGGVDNYFTRAPIHTFKACDNAWNTADKRREALAREAARTCRAGQKKKLKAAQSDSEDGHSALDPSCTFARCRDNPRCLNWLGQAAWEEPKAREKFAKQWGLSENPVREVRDPDIPVGLKNLGATCYVNSYLQVWFQDEPFRRAVYSCALDRNKDLERQPLFHLQVTFAALQEAQLKAFSPTDLVKSLDIDTTDQQDAQEFAKLLMTLLETEFAKQSDPHLKSIIARQFEGKIKYGTRCKTCRRRSENTSSFKELEVPLKNNRTLEEQLHQSLMKETLSGDNQYRCEGCNKLRDAERYTEIVQLPPVLHFSLMRFAYDFKANERKKSSAVIKFPKIINMATFVEDGPEEDWYELRGILSHKGASAHHGHYVSQIFDARRKQWFVFDDETVTPIELAKKREKPAAKRARSNTPAASSKPNSSSRNTSSRKRKPDDSDTTVIEDSDSDEGVIVTAKRVSTGPYGPSRFDGEMRTPGPSKSSSSKKRAIESESEMEENRVATEDAIESKDAYMLVYVRRGRVANMDEEQPTVPPLAAQKLYEMDCELTAEMKRYQAEEVRCGLDFERIRNTKRSVYQVWNAESDEDMSLLIDKDALHSWLTAEILPEKKTANVKSNGASNKGSKQNSSDDSESDCVEVTSKPAITLTPKRPHSSSNGTVHDPPQSPTRVPSSRKGKERAVETYMDMDETTPKCSKFSSATKPKSTSQSPVKKVPDATTTASSRVDGVADIDATTLSKTAISVTTETFLPKSLRHVTELDSSNLLCPHNLVRPAMAPQMKRVSQAGIAALIASGVKIAPDLLVPDSLCRQCAFEPVQSRSYAHEHKMAVMKFKALAEGHSNPVWTSKAWLEDWLKDNPSMHVAGTEEDAPPDDPVYQADVICEHDGLNPDEKYRCLITGRQADLLKSLFPQWSPPARSHPICEICNEDFQQEMLRRQEYKKEASMQKSTKELRRLVQQHDFKQLEVVTTRQDEEMYAVPREWLNEWRSWLKKPMDREKPHSIDLRPFLCTHELLTYDFNYREERKPFEFLYESEWDALMTYYRSKRKKEIIMKRNQKGRFETEPAVCRPCRTARRADFDEITIRLQFLIQEDIDEVTGLPKTAITIDDDDDRGSTPVNGGSYGSRRSTRARNPPGTSINDRKKSTRKAPESIYVKKRDTLKDIRVVVTQRSGTPTLYQRIFFNGREIEDSAETVESIGITEGEALQVLLLDVPDAEDVDIESFNDVLPGTRSKSNSIDKPRSNGRSEGFGGTALSGFDASARAEIQRAIPGLCGRCTFQNAIGVKQCEMCESAL